MKVRCLKCKVDVVPKSAEVVKMSNGHERIKGTCPKCGSKLSGIIS